MAEEHNIPKVYDPASVEKKWYKYWEEHRYFHAEVEADKSRSVLLSPTEYYRSAAYGTCVR